MKLTLKKSFAVLSAIVVLGGLTHRVFADTAGYAVTGTETDYAGVGLTGMEFTVSQSINLTQLGFTPVSLGGGDTPHVTLWDASAGLGSLVKLYDTGNIMSTTGGGAPIGSGTATFSYVSVGSVPIVLNPGKTYLITAPAYWGPYYTGANMSSGAIATSSFLEASGGWQGWDLSNTVYNYAGMTPISGNVPGIVDFQYTVNSNNGSPVQVGSGSYAPAVPTNQYNADNYYGLGIGDIINYYPNLHLDPAVRAQSPPIPTNKWWTDALVADRSYLPSGATQRTIVQDPLGGQLWFYPGMVQPLSNGLGVYFPNSWAAGNGQTPAGNFSTGPVLNIGSSTPPSAGSGDVLLGSFNGATWPTGWTTTGSAFGSGPTAGGSFPGESPAVTGLIDSGCANSYDGSNGATGTLTSPTFTITQSYIDFLVGGGNNTSTDYVGLVVNGQTVLSTAGQNSATMQWAQWNVSQWVGQQAQIQVVDSSTAGWGFILADYFVETNSSASPASRYGGQMDITGWGDWNLSFALQSENGSGKFVNVSLLRGTPFIWTTWVAPALPEIPVSSGTLYNSSGVVITGSSFTATSFALVIGNQTYGFFLPTNTTVNVANGMAVPQLSGSNNYMVIGLLPSQSYLSEFSGYAYAVPTNSQLSWNYSPTNGTVSTTLALTTTSWQGGQTNTLMGWLPHHYRTTTNNLTFKPYTYLTPRGTMQMTVGTSGTLTYAFHGIAPTLPAPQTTGLANDYNATWMNNYIANYAPEYAGDTYWDGKSMALNAQTASYANQVGNGAFAQLRADVEKELADWYTYTPGESTPTAGKFFAWVPNWGALLGFQCSYGSQAFNDNHFHYGYFALATAMVGMSDPNFINQYGPMAKLVTQQYANYDRTNASFPFLRTFDPWEGHSYAGGVSSPTGNNQESSSEAVQSWVGLFLLGAQLNDSNMMAAGAMGYTVETAAVNEYWQNMYGTNFPSQWYTFGNNTTLNGQVYTSGLNYGTFFGADPAEIYGIQNTPPYPWNNYLVRGNTTFAKSQYTNMYSERTQMANLGIINLGATTNDAAGVTSLDGDGWGELLLEWQSMFDSNTAASLWTQYYNAGDTVALGTGNSAAEYYTLYALRGLGSPDPNYYTSMPTSTVYYNSTTGAHNYVIYNYLPTAQSVSVYSSPGTVVQTVNVPGRTLVTNYENAPALGGVNLALGKTVTVSSTESANYPGSNAVDNNLSTRWSSAFSDPQWITVDLGAPYNINEIRLNWEAACGQNYLLQTSMDNVNWTTVETVTGNTQTGLLDYPGLSATGRYVRMYGQTRATQWGYSLYEFEVYGLPDINLAQNQPTVASSTNNGNASSYAVDGNTGTRWESVYSDPQWIYVNLGAPHVIHAVNLDWEAACGKNYLIQVSSDGVNWTTVQTVTGNTSSGWLYYPNLNVVGQYVRMYGTARATQWGYSLFEMQVEGQ